MLSPLVGRPGGADAQSPTDGNNKQEGTSTSSSAKSGTLGGKITPVIIWRFPEGVPLNHPFLMGFSIINHDSGYP